MAYDVLQVLFGPGMEGRCILSGSARCKCMLNARQLNWPKLAMAAAGITLSIPQLGFPDTKKQTRKHVKLLYGAVHINKFVNPEPSIHDLQGFPLSCQPGASVKASFCLSKKMLECDQTKAKNNLVKTLAFWPMDSIVYSKPCRALQTSNWLAELPKVCFLKWL